MTTLRTILSSLAVGALFAGCSSPTPSTSSSSHWAKCKQLDDCSALPSAAACTSGYCVDSAGSRLTAADLETDSGTGGSEPGPCDPLTPHELPVTLGTVHGIGTAPDGTTYLSDSVTTPIAADRVFVSDGDTLVRQPVKGSGAGGGPEGAEEFTFSFDRGNGLESLLAEVKNGKTTAMGLGSGGKGFIGDPGAVTTMLTVKDPNFVSTFKLKNLPGEVTIEYVADAIDGTVIVVTHPTDDYTYDDFRLFWGRTDDLVERKVDSVMRTRGSDTDIVFEVGPSGGDTLTAHFAFVLEPSDDGGIISHPGPGELTGSGTPDGFTQRWPTPTTLSGLSFTCR